MAADSEHFHSLIKLILPEEIFEFCNIIHIETVHKELNVHFDERDVKPEGFENKKLISDKFHRASIIFDFPLYARAMFWIKLKS